MTGKESKMKEGFKLLLLDIKDNKIGIILCIGCMIMLNVTLKSVCIAQVFLGIPCPACGITRALILLLKGQFKESYQMHPLLIFVIIGCILVIIIKYFLKMSLKYIKTYAIIVLVIFIFFYIFRMVRYFPNIEPMVYQKHNIIAIIKKMLLLYLEGHS